MSKLVKTIIATCLSGVVFAQTNPTTWSLKNQGNYSFTGIAASSPTLPSGMAIHQMSDKPVSLASSAISDIPLPLASGTAAQTNVRGYNTKGLGIRSAPTAASAGYTAGQLGEVVVGLNTTGRSSVTVSYKAGTIDEGTGQSADFSLRCQYRIGNTGSWSELPGGPIEYATTDVEDSVSFGPITLPSSVDDKPEVQVRWVYYYVSGSFSTAVDRSHRGRLDDISITSIPIITFPAMAEICPSSPAFVLNTATPAGGTYSGIGVSGGKFSATTSGVGVFPITYSYTDGFGMSNSAVQNYTVSLAGCITNLNPTWCNASNVSYANTIYCNPVAGAQNYEWKFTNASLGFSQTKQKGNNYYSFSVSAIPGLQYGQTYTVQVRALIQNQWANYGNPCTITMLPSIPTTQLNSSSCSAINLTMSNTLYCNAVSGATNYQYEFTNLSSNSIINYTKGNNASSLPLSAVVGLQYGQSYSVKVKSYVSGVWSSYGAPCNISMQNGTPTTQLNSTYCNSAVSSTSSVIYCNLVTNATDYEYNFSNSILNFNVTKNKGNNATSFSLSQIPGLQIGQTYNVLVRAKVNGVYGDYGAMCSISIGTTMGRLFNEEFTSTEGLANKFNTSFYPNPVSNEVIPSIKFEGGEGKLANIRVLDNYGKLVYEEQVSVLSNDFEIKLNNFPQLSSGLYSINIVTDNQVSNHKFIIE